MPGKRELFSYQGLGSSIRRAFDLTEEVVKSVTYHWRGSPEVSEFGPENGAMYRATVSPIRVLTAGFEPLGPSLVITLEAVWYFHGGPGSFHDAVESFRTGPERVYNETHRYSVRISEPDNIEPGHYMASIMCTAAETVKVPEKHVEQAVVSLLSQIIDDFRLVVSQF